MDTAMRLVTRGLLEGQEISENRGPQMALAIYIMHGLTLVVCLTRFCTRGLILRAFGLDDYMMMVTVVLSTVVTATVPLQVSSGAGAHSYELRKDQVSYIHKTAWLSQVFYLPTLCALKLSILALYSRITTKKSHRNTLITFGIILICHAFSTTMANIFLCKPQRIIWDVDVFPQGCINVLEFNYFNAAFHIVSDMVLIALPIPILGGLQISTRKRLGLAAVFSLGLAACAFTVVRVVTVVTWAHSPDFAWNWMPVALFTNLELNVGMMMACMPALNVLMKKALRMDSSREDSRGYELNDSHGASGMRSTGKKSALGYSTKIMTVDNDSEQGIIQQDPVKRSVDESTASRTIAGSPPLGSGGQGGIMQTREVEINWETREKR